MDKQTIYITNHVKESRKDLFFDTVYLDKFEESVLREPIQQVYDELYELESGNKLIYKRYGKELYN